MLLSTTSKAAFLAFISAAYAFPAPEQQVPQTNQTNAASNWFMTFYKEKGCGGAQAITGDSHPQSCIPIPVDYLDGTGIWEPGDGKWEIAMYPNQKCAARDKQVILKPNKCVDYALHGLTWWEVYSK